MQILLLQTEKNIHSFGIKLPQTAHQIGYRSGVFIRFRWDEEDVDTKSYFEFRINVIELTGDVILEITDYAYPDEKRDSIDLWNKQISSLRQRLGA